jgi:branched-chain amino acid transport system substrate-binding protein
MSMRWFNHRNLAWRRFCYRVVAALAVLSLGCPGLAVAAEPVKVGFAMPKTGFLGVASPVASQAYELWRDQVNARGGLSIGGKERRPVHFIVYDDQSTPSKTAQIYEKLITHDKVDLLLAPYATPFHIAIGPVVERHKFPVIGAAAGSTLLRDLKARYIWFAEKLTDSNAADIVSFLKAQGVKSIALLTLQLPLSLEIKKYATPTLKGAGIQILVNSEYPPDIKDMTSMLSAVKSANPDAIVALSYPEDSLLYVTTARELDLNQKIQFLLIGPSGSYFAKKFSAQDVDGFMTIGHWSPSQKQWPRAKAFNDAYMAKWRDHPDYLDSVVSYVTCEVLEQAVAQAGLNREKLREVIATSTFDTINGPVKFKGAENESMPSGLLQIQRGQLEIIWPEKIATSKFQPKPMWRR